MPRISRPGWATPAGSNASDGRLDIVLKGDGQVAGQLPAGVYRVRWRAGDASEELILILRPGQQRTLRQSAGLAFRSAAPMEGTSTSHVHQRDAALAIGREPPLVLGQGSELVL